MIDRLLICYYTISTASRSEVNIFLYLISNDDRHPDGLYRFTSYDDSYKLRSGNFISIDDAIEPDEGSYFSFRSSFEMINKYSLLDEKVSIEGISDNESYKKYQSWYGGGSDNKIVYLHSDYKSIFRSLEREYTIDNLIS